MKEKLRKTCSRVFILLGLFFIMSPVLAQDKTVSGKVLDENGAGLPGASITVKGTTGGTNTDANGDFRIAVKSGATLVFSSIGYAKQEIAVGNQSEITVKMVVDVANLNEVVVTALGISKEARKIGYAVSTIDGGQMTKARETNVAYSLAGRVAGLNISGTSGGPGSSARILLRGMASFSAGTPLFVINGVPMDNSQRRDGNSGEWGGADQGDGISNINPDDIETMTVLKGAAASALYGARAANGVILITTKGGKKGSMAVEYNANAVADKMINYTDYQYEYGQGQHGVKPANVTSALNSGMYSWGAKLDGQMITQFDGKQYAYSAVKNNLEKFYRTGSTFTNSVSVSNGNDNGTFRLSFANLSNKSILRNSGLDRKTFNFTGSQKFGKKLKVDLMVNYVNEKFNNKPQLSDGPMNANNINFLANSVDQKALQPGYDINSPVGAEIQYNDDIYVTNPWFVVNRYDNDLKRKRLITAITARYDITSWLYAMGRVGYDRINDGLFKITPTGTAYSQDQKGSLDDQRNSEINELNMDAFLGSSKNITEELSLDVLIGGSIRKNSYESMKIGGGPFVLPFFYSWSNVVSFNRDYNFNKKEAHSGFYTVDLSYKNFTLNTTGRYDAFSTLPKGNYGVFTPSVSASYNFADLLNKPNFNYGKVRASYAQVSGEADPYQTSQYYTIGSTIGGVTTGSFDNKLPNLTLQPYVLTEVEVGTELKFYDNRLGLDVAYFNRKTKNEIIDGPLSQATGYTSQFIGTGSTKNSGLEAMLTVVPLQTEKFRWTSTFNFTAIKNRIVEIDGSGNESQVKVLGTYRPLNANTALIKGMAGPQVYAYDYMRDAAGNIVIDATGVPMRDPKQKAMGSVLPKVYGGWNNEFAYGGFNLAFLFDYKFGNKLLSATNYYSTFRGLNKNTLEGREANTIVAKGVLEGGTPNTKAVDVQDYYQELARRISSMNVLDGSFIKLRQVTLGYTLTSKMLGKLPFESIGLSFVARNLLTIVKHTDNIDPEAGFSAAINYAGIEGGSLPATRSYGLNVSVKFKK
ncbi:SusC/RagA family TonB-linked outer membrane protein [Dyadobacter diqingensis]|uniref:SusC/RagA family TonB-linked outer membrane protein n=1 Tax=Dyadobacter diqingensis TaxID=2938121 RepID=UPI0020C352CF|nr:SusC/RagA family TonB-linked outer membrane protein [Dyadobacter diqingensis]